MPEAICSDAARRYGTPAAAASSASGRAMSRSSSQTGSPTAIVLATRSATLPATVCAMARRPPNSSSLRDVLVYLADADAVRVTPAPCRRMSRVAMPRSAARPMIGAV